MEEHSKVQFQRRQIISELFSRCVRQQFCRFDFKDDFPVDNQVASVKAQLFFLEYDWNRIFSIDLQATFPQLRVHSTSVDRFEKTIAEAVVHVIKRSDDFGCSCFVQQLWAHKNEYCDVSWERWSPTNAEGSETIRMHPDE